MECFECIVECFGFFVGILNCCECVELILGVLSFLGECRCVWGLLDVFVCVCGVLWMRLVCLGRILW